MEKDDIYKRLGSIIDPEQVLSRRKIVTVAENGVRYRLENLDDYFSAVFRIDGGIVKDTSQKKCDRLILLRKDKGAYGAMELFVELKGGNISRAIDQLDSTVDMPVFRHTDVDRRKDVLARIVARRLPAANSNPEVERKKRAFVKKHGNILKILSNGSTDRL